MRDYILINLTMESSSTLEVLFDDNILKEIAFGTKYKQPKLEYENVLIPLIEINKESEIYNDYIIELPHLKASIVNQNLMTDNILFSIYSVIKDSLYKAKTLAIQILNIINEDSIGISYTDGSFSKNQTKAGYACCVLLDEAPNGLYDDFTNKNFIYDAYSGTIEDGTNNIGELTAIKVAVEHFNSKQYQLIISDSIYGIKSYREYIHVWKNNGYKAYNKKPIKNKELILETYDEIKKQQNNKIILFKWTKGHSKNSFNDKCDELAKLEIGL